MPLELALRPAWNWNAIRHTRETIAAKLRDLDEPLRDACVMAVSELLENAVKYGEEPDEESVHVQLTNDEIVVSVMNRIAAPESLCELMTHIDEVAHTNDPQSAYLKQMELLWSSGGNGHLGLYRIAHEGGFSLSCQVVEQCVIVRATKRSRAGEQRGTNHD